ncbi:MAG: four helix bundle protein [Balneolaceae bacterium]|nr:four helix bundle protein [Balneolaceae bacterium]
MRYKFEDLDVWNLSLDLSDLIFDLANELPEEERYNLISQIDRAATSIALNIAEGSTSQTDGEQSRFLGYAIRSLIEVIGCLRIIERRKYIQNVDLTEKVEDLCDQLFIKLQAFKKSLN